MAQIMAGKMLCCVAENGFWLAARCWWSREWPVGHGSKDALLCPETGSVGRTARRLLRFREWPVGCGSKIFAGCREWPLLTDGKINCQVAENGPVGRGGKDALLWSENGLVG
jgi:hypothetical protein